MAKVTYRPKKVVQVRFHYHNKATFTLLTVPESTDEAKEETVVIVLDEEELSLLIAALDYSGGLELTPMVTDFEKLRSEAFGGG